MERGIVLVGLNHRTAPVEVRERVAFANGRLEPSLGQLMAHYAVAAAAGASGQILHRCFHRSFSVAKRIRRETRIAEKAVSIGSAAVELSRVIFDRLADKSALLLGAGAMGELTARQLLAQGVGSVMVANRTFDRAIDVARTLGAMPVPWDRLPRYLPLADLVIAAASGEEFLLPRAAIEEAMRERRHRAMFLIDLAVPRALDPAVNQLDNVYLYDIDDLEGVVTQNRGARAREAAKAETIVDTEVDTFWRWYTSLDVVPTIVALRERMKAIRRYEGERSLAALGALDPRQREARERPRARAGGAGPRGARRAASRAPRRDGLHPHERRSGRARSAGAGRSEGPVREGDRGRAARGRDRCRGPLDERPPGAPARRPGRRRRARARRGARRADRRAGPA